MAESVGVNPAAPAPPVGFRIWFPKDWHLVDLAPRTANRSIDRFLDWCAREAPASAQHRTETRRALRQVVRQNQARGIFLLGFLAATRDGRADHPIGASLTLAWQKLPDGELPPARTIARGMAQGLAAGRFEEGETPDSRFVSVVELRAGPAAHLRTTQLVPVPWLQSRQPVRISQFMIPVPDQPWFGVVTATSPQLDLTEVVEVVAEAVAQSLEFHSGPEMEVLIREMESRST